MNPTANANALSRPLSITATVIAKPTGVSVARAAYARTSRCALVSTFLYPAGLPGTSTAFPAESARLRGRRRGGEEVLVLDPRLDRRVGRPGESSAASCGRTSSP